jgi:hypothetical protein
MALEVVCVLPKPWLSAPHHRTSYAMHQNRSFQDFMYDDYRQTKDDMLIISISRYID